MHGGFQAQVEDSNVGNAPVHSEDVRIGSQSRCAGRKEATTNPVPLCESNPSLPRITVLQFPTLFKAFNFSRWGATYVSSVVMRGQNGVWRLRYCTDPFA